MMQCIRCTEQCHLALLSSVSRFPSQALSFFFIYFGAKLTQWKLSDHSKVPTTAATTTISVAGLLPPRLVLLLVFQMTRQSSDQTDDTQHVDTIIITFARVCQFVGKKSMETIDDQQHLLTQASATQIANNKNRSRPPQRAPKQSAQVDAYIFVARGAVCSDDINLNFSKKSLICKTNFKKILKFEAMNFKIFLKPCTLLG